MNKQLPPRTSVLPIKSFLWMLWFVFILLAAVFPAQAQTSDEPEVVILQANTSVTPVLVTYLERGFKLAVEDNADLIIIELNTPGGSVESMNVIIQLIRSSEIPVVVYVTPRNAMAASAGAIITMAGHLSAMAPETTIGAASPVGSQGEDIEETLNSKVKEILKASIRNLTLNRSPEAVSLAEEMVESARAVTVDEALEAGLIDIKASDRNDLLYQLQGRTGIISGETFTLNTRGASIQLVNTTFIEDVLNLLLNPNLVFLLLSIGVQAILIEISSPGGWVAGFFGIVCILLAIYGLGILPVNWFGIIFLVIAFVLFILDIKAPTHGALTIAGVATFITGALVLFNTTRLPGIPPISVPLVVGTGLFIGATFFIAVTFAIRAQFTPIQTGKESLPGKFGVVKTDLVPQGMVQAAGELWGAIAAPDEGTIREGEEIVVVEVVGLQLIVRRRRIH